MNSNHDFSSTATRDEHHPQIALTEHYQHNRSCGTAEGVLAIVSDLWNSYSYQDWVPTCPSLPFQGKEITQSEWESWHRPLDPVPTEEETLQMVELRRRKYRRWKRQLKQNQ